MSINKFTPPNWICEEQYTIPVTKDGCAPAITATYEYASFANMISTAHYPRMGVLESGYYEENEVNTEGTGVSYM